MGTSVSNRSPDTARWRAVQSAYIHGLPDERVALEVTQAAEPWKVSLLSPTFDAFLSTLVAAFDDVPRQLTVSPPDAVIRNLSAAAYEAATAASGDLSGLPIAERALHRTLIGCLRSDELISETSAADATSQWLAQRGETPRDLAQRFVGEVLQQFGRHVIARDLGAVVGGSRIPNTEAARQLSARVADKIATRATRAFSEAALSADVGAAWHRAVTTVFSREEPS